MTFSLWKTKDKVDAWPNMSKRKWFHLSNNESKSCSGGKLLHDWHMQILDLILYIFEKLTLIHEKKLSFAQKIAKICPSGKRETLEREGTKLFLMCVRVCSKFYLPTSGNFLSGTKSFCVRRLHKNNIYMVVT